MRRCATLVLMLALAVPCAAQRPVERLAWMSGCWKLERAGRVIEEQWMPPRGNTMLGMGRTVRDTALVEFEHLRILDRGGKAVYHAEPSGQTPADFEAITLTDTLVVFSNPAHDFPQRVIYERRGRDSLVARVEGTLPSGQSRAQIFAYGRVGCG